MSDKSPEFGPFTPKDTVPVTIGRSQVNVYPRVDPLWTTPEKAHAFHVTKSALYSVSLTPDVHLDTFGQFMNASAVVDSQRFEFDDRFCACWLDMTYLTILSFHNSQGQVIANATIDADPSILKPVADGPVGDCRPPDVKFARLQIALDFRDLCTAAEPTDNTTLRTTYYLELPQTSVPVNNANNVARNLTTFHGPDDLRTMSVEQLRADILNAVYQDQPIDLTEPAFNLGTVSTESQEMKKRISNLILRIAMKTIEMAIFESICPNYSMEPQAAVEAVRQTVKDAEGNDVTYTVAQYYTNFINSARPLLSQRTLPIDLVGGFVKNTHPDIFNVLKETYPKFNDVRSRESRFQRNELNLVVRLAISAEHRISSTQSIINRTIGSQALTCNPTDTVPAYPSVAERTLSRYKEGDGNNRSESPTKRRRRGGMCTCFGCGGPHPFSKCPDKDKPEVQALAKVNREKYMSLPGRGGGKANRMRSGAPNFNDLSEKGKEKMKNQVLASALGLGPSSVPAAGASDVSTITAPSSPAKKPPTVLICRAKVLNTTSREALPVPISSLLPHINVGLGVKEEDCSVMMSCVVDTGASITTGNFFYCSYIAKTFPAVVSRVLTSDHFSPITLSGVVQAEGSSVTTDLPVAFEFHMPYTTTDGTPTTLLVACGPQVSVNLILGFPFMSATGMSIDFVDNVADCKKLSVPPFSIEHKKARVHVPQRAAINLVDTDLDFYGRFISDMETLDEKITAAYNIRHDIAPKRARFESDSTPSRVDDVTDTVVVDNSESSDVPFDAAPLSNETIRDALRDIAGLGMETHDRVKAE